MSSMGFFLFLSDFLRGDEFYLKMEDFSKYFVK